MYLAAIFSKLIQMKLMKKNRARLFLSLTVICLAGVSFFLWAMPAVLGQQYIKQLDYLPSPQPGERILIFSPHPDDETIALGGYIDSACQAGAEVEIVLVTDGSKFTNKEIRYQEFESACRLLGVAADHLVFLDFKDGSLRSVPVTLLIDCFGALINSFMPDIVFYPHPQDAHDDHAAVSRAVRQCLKVTPGIRGYEYLVHYRIFFPQPRVFNQNLYLLPPLTLVNEDHNWLKFDLSEEQLERKLAALSAYASQLKNPFLKPLMQSFIRQNELVCLPN
ncbi:PIG-L deacetylase family protein [Dehalococcoides mccartyi]|uniref:LmbE-like family protein n=2 Tax=Dehalococcoides mccartyi TaxID=61435 RepID=A0A916KLM5_DEHMC|nr:PIG-L family deacetylase [Dehalococcoides mccartyi]AII60400.1 LmbE family protein [Dehalococcoides mccartyi CG5]CAI82457.1 LmbE-like family protein [Dehalococcoides mccartyi CBDB1]AMU86041.1 putative deacetylase [Dehalococcoides mccartyi]AOV98849.1 YaiS [Dehalococcoides mccartyi]AQX72771.1 PIG-L family deacetylase [Dehalococcoides mccartyi]